MNTIIGKPIITASGFQIIPFSKVTLANLSGGGEYGDVKIIKETQSSILKTRLHGQKKKHLYLTARQIEIRAHSPPQQMQKR